MLENQPSRTKSAPDGLRNETENRRFSRYLSQSTESITIPLPGMAAVLRHSSGLGSAVVPIAVGRVSRPTSSRIRSYGFSLGFARAQKGQAGKCLAGRQTPHAGRTRSHESPSSLLQSPKPSQQKKCRPGQRRIIQVELHTGMQEQPQ